MDARAFARRRLVTENLSKDRYVPQNLVFVVAGDVNTHHVLDEVLKQFAAFQRTTERGVVLPAEPDQASPRSIASGEDGSSCPGFPRQARSPAFADEKGNAHTIVRNCCTNRNAGFPEWRRTCQRSLSRSATTKSNTVGAMGSHEIV